MDSDISTTSFDTFKQFSNYRLFHLKTSQHHPQPPKKLGLFCTLSAPKFKSSCDCEHINGKCELSLRWIELIYPASQYAKLEDVFRGYQKNKKLDLGNVPQEIEADVMAISTVYDMKNPELVEKVLLCFAKHNLYYHKKPYCKNYAWIAAALMYHADMCISFWVLDAMADAIGLREEDDKLMKLANNVYYRIGVYFPAIRKKLENQGLDLKKVVQYLMSDLMFSYIPIQFASYAAEQVLKNGVVFFQKLVLSYLDKRFEAVKKKTVNGVEFLMICLLNNDVEWPIIFCNMNSFKF